MSPQAMCQVRSNAPGVDLFNAPLPVRLKQLKEPTDGRWPFHPPKWNLSKSVSKAMAVTPLVVLLVSTLILKLISLMTPGHSERQNNHLRNNSYPEIANSVKPTD
eukprot:762444-Hanusia_phi.AAC.3